MQESPECARKAWLTFEEMYRSVTTSRKLMLTQQLATLRMQPGESAAKYISRVKELKREMIRAGLSAKEINLAAIYGLSSEFKEIRIILEYTPEEDLSLNKILPTLMQHEARVERDENLDKRSSSTAFHGKGSFQKRNIGNREFRGSCYNCGQEGHRQRDCTHPPNKGKEKHSAGDQDQKSSRRDKHKDCKCNFCGKRVHEEDVCRLKAKLEKKKGDSPAAAFAANDKSL
jgi:hypothetical protein